MTQSRTKTGRLLVGSLCIAMTMLVPLWADLGEEADRAWNAERYVEALAAYDRILENDPEQYRALMRTARMLAWENRLAESIARYERVLEVAPDDRDAGLGYAVALSWDGRLDRSIETLESLTQRFPGDRELLLAHARVQGWDGRYQAARSSYRKLFDADPGDIEAMLGTARTYAWSGRLAQARIWYDRALRAESKNKDARVGQAYVDLWSGAIGAAARAARDLKAEYATDADVEKLYSSVSRSAGAWSAIDLSRIDDTDDNRLDRHAVAGGFGLGGGVRLDTIYERFEMSDVAGDASIDGLQVSIQFTPRHGQQLSTEIGYDRRTRTDGTTDSDLLGGLRYSWGLDRRWQVHASALRVPLRYSPQITDAGILFDQLELRTTGALGERFRLHLTAGSAEFSDGNGREHLLAGFTYKVPVQKTTLHVGYTARLMDYDSDLANGYFDPQDFFAQLAQLTVRGEFGKRASSYSFYLNGGFQSFTVGGTEVDNDTVLIVGGTLGVPLGNRLRFELYAEHGDHAATNPGGFESTRAGLRLIWRAGLN